MSLFGEEGSDKSEQAHSSECGSTSRALSMSIPYVLVFRELALFASSLFRMSIQSLIPVHNFLEYSSSCSSLARKSLIWPSFLSLVKGISLMCIINSALYLTLFKSIAREFQS
ncbi:orf112b (mitochondrion) [Beta vulgaris subsp. vulgaris]|uniref:Orf112b protein n=3 Tax=Beta TaxID=3554 RepID=Q9MF72_BETVV|nr:orf112b [Beta vulgaris subsp. vulgaris]YP_004222245.1 hypothetical protein LKY74_mgp006 [Beta vulgaris subsp. maritima]YP_004842095.1 hypothetical protein LKY79_mgp113 [Beta macrocarpa]CBJ14030.1 hypothetical protein [Beta vulgaris subsp. maritima]CBJ17488.1 hypothetical protein [Beta vulgaris subsp. maritima]CBJ20758.1 hypothetical protein [Beta vulgaris subsp. maritima]CBL52002.1 hypothetical protein [Beta vulgaris subsp. maritima]CBX24897.1 hypothetical protein [Beta macrocarpa]